MRGNRAACEICPMVGRAVEPTPLVGRRQELESIKKLLEGSRLVTLTGVGGTGKTRLARRASIDLARAFKDGVWFVELADIEDPDLLGQTVSRAVGLKVGSGDWSASVLINFLEQRRALLVFDNCEHLAQACADLVDEILEACSGIRVLTTSQRALGLTSEALFQVPPLALPVQDGVDLETIHHYGAVRLFVDRARALGSGFELTQDNSAAVIELCRALDGIPLALELAAARIRVLSPQAMVDRLNDRYRLLSHGYAGRVPDRQRSLEASVQWTFDLCNEPERRLWAVLSVFRGGMGLEDLEEVVPAAGIEDVLGGLTGLVEKSVLLREDNGQQVRFRMLESIRLYGEQRLAASGDLERIRELHLQHFLVVAERCGAEWIGPDQVAWLERLRNDHPNIRTALQFCVDRTDEEHACRIISSLEGFWVAAGLVREARLWFERVRPLACDDNGDAPLWRLAALRVAVWFALIQVDMVTAARLVDEIEWATRGSDDDAARAHVLMARGLLLAWEGDPARGRSLIEQCVDLHRKVGNSADLAFGMVVDGMLLGFGGEVEQARQVQLEVVALTESRGELYYRSFALAMIGALSLDPSAPERSREVLEECLRMKHQLDDRLGIALSMEFMAWVAAIEEGFERAAILLGAASATWRSIGVSVDVLPFFSTRRAEGRDVVRRMLPGGRYMAAEARGEGMTLEAAIAFALGEAEGASRPAATSAPAQSSPLTRRETEVAVLVAEGLTNQQIADRLVISIRTAEAHVENILRKLGVDSRHAITAWSLGRGDSS
ncbi:ATP-binding protein [Nocardioides sp. NPDC101246]|uniref:ATP-binding protein n=1 Tax=Nocardioides sp. NPDC101246 TaxID=3364336 RepID=UPI003803BD36